MFIEHPKSDAWRAHEGIISGGANPVHMNFPPRKLIISASFSEYQIKIVKVVWLKLRPISTHIGMQNLCFILGWNAQQILIKNSTFPIDPTTISML